MNIKYSVKIDGRETELIYVIDFPYYKYVDPATNKEHSFKMPLARYPLNEAINENGHSYIITKKP